MSELSVGSRADERGLAGWIRRHPVVALGVLIVGTYWVIAFWQILAARHVLSVAPPALLGLFAGWIPGLVAVILAGVTAGRAGMRELLGRFTIWRLKPGWYALAIFAPLALMLVAAGITVLIGGQVSDMPFFRAGPAAWLPRVVILLVAGMLLNTEEIAWRGFAVPRLQPRYGLLGAALLITIPEFLVHVPYFFDPSTTQAQIGPIWFLAFTAAEVVLFTYVFNSTRGSLLIVTLLHAAQNAWSDVLSGADATSFKVAIVILMFAASVVVVALRRARLPHQDRVGSGSQPASLRFDIRSWVARHMFAALVTLVLVLTWACMLPQVAVDSGRLPGPYPPLVGLLEGWMPGLAAVIVAGVALGRPGVRELLGRFLIWRVSIGWYLLALLAPAAILLGGVGLLALIGGKPGPLPVQAVPAAQWLPASLLAIALGMIFNTEEIAWRGLALPWLRPQHGALVASLIIAVPWYIFHLPLMFAPSTPVAAVGPYWLFVQIVTMSVILAWLFINTGGSLLIVTLAHAALNTWPTLLAGRDARILMATDVVLLACAVGLVLAYGPALARQKRAAAVLAEPGE